VGLISTVVYEIVAIVFFVRTFETGHRFRNLFSVLSIFFAALLLLLTCGFVWWSWSRARG